MTDSGKLYVDRAGTRYRLFTRADTGGAGWAQEVDGPPVVHGGTATINLALRQCSGECGAMIPPFPVCPFCGSALDFGDATLKEARCLRQ
jgi:hypothetical protein